MFVNVEHPSQLRELRIRKKARSHVSRLQHKQRRDALEHAIEISKSLPSDRGDNMSISQRHSSTPNLIASGITTPDAILDAMVEPCSLGESDPRYLEPKPFDLVYHPSTTTTSGSNFQMDTDRASSKTCLNGWKQDTEEDSICMPQRKCVTSKAQLSRQTGQSTFNADSRAYSSSLAPSDKHDSLAKGLDMISTDMLVCLHHALDIKFGR
jgi:hypothetical protein